MHALVDRKKRGGAMTRLTKMMLLLVVASTLDAKADPKPDGRELLAEHETVAMFEGVKDRRCRGLTAECPDKCGNSGKFATFTIKKYISFKKHGKYGAKQQRYTVQMTGGGTKADKKTLEGIKALEKGSYVLLNWNHDYVTKNRSSSPETPVTKVEKISDAKAKELQK
jgi:hypothetical protein